MIPYSFWKDVEKPMKYVQYGDTDSLYIALDTKPNSTTDELVAEADKISNAINDQIIYFIESCFLPKLGVDISHNKTFFKTELVADAIMFLDIKKNYAFRELANNGKIHPKPSVEYVGIPVVRNNIAKFTKDFIKAIVESIALNKEITSGEMKKQLQVVAKEFWEKLQKDCTEFNFNDIGIPCKWGSNYTKEPFQVIAMRTYNTISGEDAFTPSMGGINVPIKISNQSTFMNAIAKLKNRNEFCLGSISVQNVNYIALPYNRDQQKTKELMNKFGLTVDVTEYWGILYNTVAKRIVDTIKGV